jgi:hypothetical protein
VQWRLRQLAEPREAGELQRVVAVGLALNLAPPLDVAGNIHQRFMDVVCGGLYLPC